MGICRGLQSGGFVPQFSGGAIDQHDAEPKNEQYVFWVADIVAAVPAVKVVVLAPW